MAEILTKLNPESDVPSAVGRFKSDLLQRLGDRNSGSEGDRSHVRKIISITHKQEQKELKALQQLAKAVQDFFFADDEGLTWELLSAFYLDVAALQSNTALAGIHDICSELVIAAIGHFIKHNPQMAMFYSRQLSGYLNAQKQEAERASQACNNKDNQPQEKPGLEARKQLVAALQERLAQLMQPEFNPSPTLC